MKYYIIHHHRPQTHHPPRANQATVERLGWLPASTLAPAGGLVLVGTSSWKNETTTIQEPIYPIIIYNLYIYIYSHS